VTRALRIAVVGDLLLDRDIVGRVERICPDSPAPVLDVSVEHARPGGAGLAAALLAADGHDVSLVTALGDDPAGVLARSLLERRGVRVVALATDGVTREKVRVRAGDQSLVRVDRGTSCRPVGSALCEEMRGSLGGADAVLVSDYAGGVLSDEPVRSAVAEAAHRVPVVWDPHARGAAPVPGCRIVTPNSGEAAALAGQDAPVTSLSAASRLADALLAQWGASSVCVTMGEHGALLTYGSGSPLVAPARRVEGGDPCGAGDRFAAAAVAALARGRTESESVLEAVSAASEFVAAGGAAAFAASTGDVAVDEPPDQDRSGVAVSGWDRVAQVRTRGGTVVATGGCFDLLHAGHVALLRAARELGDCLVVCLNSDDSVRRLKGGDRPLVTAEDRVRVLEALEFVDAVQVFDEDTPAEALRALRPDVWAKGGDYTLADLPEAAVLAEWGGQAVVLPYLDGRSTSALIGAARGRTPSSEESA
jgi:rfaE bifunctional protein nucleotidyltransferase chain/domain/rfaE bifunctional protein kinase chain/domain